MSLEHEKTLLKIQKLNLGFHSKKEKNQVIFDLSLELKHGECIGLVGESGSGKSISSLSTMGLLPKNAFIESGKVLFNNGSEEINLLEQSEKTLQKLRGKQIAMIFQEPMTSLNPVIKCGEQVAEALRLHKELSRKEAKQECLKWFEEVKLPRVEAIYNSYPHQLSGGQKQRVMIAMAICCKPKLLIADEPTTALDVTVQNDILLLIQELQKKMGMSVIFITHDLGVVAQVADRIAVMKKGRVVEQGEVKSIFQNPSHPYTKGLIACRPPENHRLKRLPTVDDFLNDADYESKISALKISKEERRQNLEHIEQSPSIFKIQNLKTYYPIQKGVFKRTVGFVKAVDDVSFEVKEGETLGLVGESGCGKTSLGRSILQLIKPSSGKVFYRDVELVGMEESELRKYRKDIQIIFQDPYSSLNPRMRVGEIIREPMEVHKVGANSKERKERVIELMETVGLTADQYMRYPHEFSGGQRQRISIARAIGLSPKFIICDESVSALDVSVQAQVLNLLNELKDKHHFTYIFISHDLSVIKYMSDRVMVMKDGKIVEEGEADQLYSDPKNPYTQKLVESIPRIPFLRA